MSEQQHVSRETLRRVAALQLAIDSTGGYQEPESTLNIIARAEAFLAFIEPRREGAKEPNE